MAGLWNKHASRQGLSEYQLSLLNIPRAPRNSGHSCAEVSDLPLISPIAWVIRSSTRCPWPSHTHPITRYIGTGTYTWRAYRFPRWPPVVLSYSQVEVLKHAPGTISRVFPACNAWQNALTLTDSSSALSIPPAPFLELTLALPSSVRAHHKWTLRDEQIPLVCHALR